MSCASPVRVSTPMGAGRTSNLDIANFAESGEGCIPTLTSAFGPHAGQQPKPCILHAKRVEQIRTRLTSCCGCEPLPRVGA